MGELIDGKFGGRLRIRVNGILVEDDKILLVKLAKMGDAGFLWMPPGGGMHFGSDARGNLVREFEEETGLKVEVKSLLFVNEYLNDPLHALELFFQVKKTGGELRLGTDPELSEKEQILEEIRFFSFSELDNIDRKALHNLFRHCDSIEQLLNMKGYFNY